MWDGGEVWFGEVGVGLEGLRRPCRSFSALRQYLIEYRCAYSSRCSDWRTSVVLYSSPFFGFFLSQPIFSDFCERLPGVNFLPIAPQPLWALHH